MSPSSIDRSKAITIYFENRRIPAHPGQTIAGALYAAGVRIFSRSFKYHRPRGLLCAAGRCPNCLMNVNGEPNVRTCMTPVADGQRIRSQNAWPSLETDIFSLIERFSRLLPVGFYYKTLIRPRSMWPTYEKVLRHIAGLGEIDIHTVPDAQYEQVYRHADVAVIGGGPAGLSAALEAARTGADVVLVDDQRGLGGHLRTDVIRHDGQSYTGLIGVEIAGMLANEVVAHPNIEVLSGATAFGYYEGDLMGVIQGRRLIQLRMKRAIIATGRFEHPLIFQNNDLPGIMLGSGVQRLLYLDGVKPGQAALVVTTNDFGLTVATDLLRAGVRVEAVVDGRPSIPETAALQVLQQFDIPILPSHSILEASGTNHVSGATVVRLDENGHVVHGSERHVGCDVIALSTGFEPAAALIYQSGGKMRYDEAEGAFVPASLQPAVAAVGDVAGLHDLDAQLLDGQTAGLRAAIDLGLGGVDATARCAQLQATLDRLRQQGQTGPNRTLVSIPHHAHKKFVCLCEDLMEKDVCDAIDEGFDHIETLKRYSTLSMGPCQGKMCSMACVALCARQTGRTIQETGTTTSRPPYQPVSLGALAGSVHEPVKRTPIHHRHVALGAQMMDMGQWKRPKIYTSPLDEYKAVRERVGLIDVGTLGKLDVKGRDAVRLLDKVYTNGYRNLKPGRVRYGVMCDESGIILDDGTVTRLADDHVFITTTTGNVEFVHEWLEWWAAGTDLCVHITNVTAGYAAVNLAGPRARDLLNTLTDTDLSTAAVPYMASAQGRVAGIPALMFRIGFVGELGYEMHVPAEYGEALWDALMDAGQRFNITPFGVEAQRLLRLEKKHVIVGQDTDALSNPIEADMAWVVKFDKPDFIGKASLLRVQERGLRQKLVGFVTDDGAAVDEGNAIVVDGKSIGRVTSFRQSPAMGKGVGMAWVPAEMAGEGAPLSIHVAHNVAAARVYNRPFYDPDGTRLRA